MEIGDKNQPGQGELCGPPPKKWIRKEVVVVGNAIVGDVVGRVKDFSDACKEGKEGDRDPQTTDKDY